MTPTEKHRETAKDIAFDFDCDWTADGRRRGEEEYHAAIKAIAAALAKAEREGMKRAAEIALAQLFAKHPEKGRTTSQEKLYSRDRAMCRRISRAILSEAGKDE